MSPRPKQERQVLHEQHLADQIRQERAKRGWSLDNLAQRMTDSGCPMDRSAIHRIESGKPPRRITVDEAVVFAQVFSRNLQSMLLPAAVLRNKEVRRLYEQLQKIEAQESEMFARRRGLEKQLVELADNGHAEDVLAALDELLPKYERATTLPIPTESEVLLGRWSKLHGGTYTAPPWPELPPPAAVEHDAAGDD